MSTIPSNRTFGDEDDYAASYEYDERIIMRERPVVLDGGSVFRDKHNILHTDACGWIAIHAALHLLLFCGLLPKKIADRLARGELAPGELKAISGTTQTDVRISREDFTAIGNAIGVQFVIHEPDMPSLRHQRFGKKRNSFQVHLYFALAHYTVNLRKFDEQILEEFTTVFRHLNYTVINLADQCYSESDRQLALRLANESDSTFDNDRQLALRLANESDDLVAELATLELIDKQIEEEDQFARDRALAMQLAQGN
jgi:hypothetical protein